MLEVAVKQLSCCPSCLSEFLQAHTTQMFPIDIKLLERYAVGIQLVGIKEVLQPLPDLKLSPVLWVYFVPLSSIEATGDWKRKNKIFTVSDSIIVINSKIYSQIACLGSLQSRLFSQCLTLAQ